MDIDEVAEQLRAHGFATAPHALPPELLAGLDGACHDSLEFPFVPSGMGRVGVRQPNASVRGDVILWLDGAKNVDRAYLSLMETLRLALNEKLYLGLNDYQGHYAIYEAGTHYDKHRDSLTGKRNRLLSSVVYLNSGWAAADGGELLLYHADEPGVIARILPQPGLLVLFLSEEFPHEVLSATRARHSIAGWFSGRPRSLLRDPS
jgi:SM-20-related protein